MTLGDYQPKICTKNKNLKNPNTTFVLHPKGMLCAKFSEHWTIL
jgi:hypothetical protein